MRKITAADLSAATTADLRYGLKWAQTNYQGFAIVAGQRAMVGEMLAELDRRGEGTPQIPEREAYVPPGWAQQGGVALELEPGTKCRRCGHGIETEAERRMVFGEAGELLDEHRERSMCLRAKYQAGDYAGLPDSYENEER